jgi:hypothetical protein
MRTISVVSAGMGHGTKVTDAVSGQPIFGISGVTISIQPNDLVRATVLIDVVEVQTTAEAEFMAADPVTGEMKVVAEIVFADGTRATF